MDFLKDCNKPMIHLHPIIYQKKILAKTFPESFIQKMGMPLKVYSGSLRKGKEKGCISAKRGPAKMKVNRIPKPSFLTSKRKHIGHISQFSHLVNGNNAEGEGSLFSENTSNCFTGNEVQWTRFAKWYLNQQFKFA